jgi:xanthine dehydrogenase accessory factor
MLEIYEEIIKLLNQGGEAALATVIAASASTPRKVGSRMLVRADGSILGTIGGGSVEFEVIKIASGVIQSGKPEKHQFILAPDKELRMVCGGEMEIFIEPVRQAPTMYIFGAGHIALALSKIVKMLDFRVVVTDDRPAFANEERFPEAEMVLAEDFPSAFAKLKIDPNSYIVIVTHNHAHDQEALEWALKTQAKYIGMIGSKNKIKTVFDNLEAKGVERKALNKVHSPIGLEIHAETPEEIAISILAEIIKVKRSPSGQT